MSGTFASYEVSGKRFKVSPRPIKGRTSAARSCLWRALTEWMMMWVLVRPRTALGFFLNAWTKESLNLLEREL